MLTASSGVALVVLAAVPAPASAQTPSSVAPALVLDGVGVVDVKDGTLLPAQRVVIAGNRIQAIGPANRVPIPRGAQLVPARGKYLIPGLWDMHVHPMQYVDVVYPLFIANGVTGVRDAGSNVPLATFARWKQEIAAGTRVGPRLIVSGQAIDAPAEECRGSDGSHHICVSTPAEARLVVDLFKTAGADMIKTYSLPREMYLVIAAEARRVSIPFGGHVGNITRLGGLEASDSGARILDHDAWLNPNVCGESSDVAATIDTVQCAAAGAHLRRNGTWVMVHAPARGQVILLVFGQRILEQWRRYESPAMFRKLEYMISSQERALARPAPTSTADWAAAVALLDSFELANDKRNSRQALVNTALDQKYLPIIAGTDALGDGLSAVSGFGLHDVLALYVVNGMTPLAALQTATLNPAQALHATDSLGTIEAGKLADLVLLDADPLQDIWNTTKIRAVIANGRYYDRAALDRLLAEAERAAHR